MVAVALLMGVIIPGTSPISSFMMMWVCRHIGIIGIGREAIKVFSS